MGFSKEWDSVYKSGNQLSIWPWTKLVSLVYRYVKPVPNMKVLELGCGAGANIGFFQALNVDYYAIEGSWSMVEKLQKKYSVENIHIELCSWPQESSSHPESAGQERRNTQQADS